MLGAVDHDSTAASCCVGQRLQLVRLQRSVDDSRVRADERLRQLGVAGAGHDDRDAVVLERLGEMAHRSGGVAIGHEHDVGVDSAGARCGVLRTGR